jgi:preprotein translocase subunit SecY
VFQLFLGGMLVMFMDEIVSKWGFGSGISLFIASIRSFNLARENPI